MKLAIFDLAGTTVEDGGQVREAFKATLALYQIPITQQELESVRGKSKQEVIRSLVERLPGIQTARLAEEVFTVFREKLFESVENGSIKIVNGAVETFAWLRDRNIKIGLNTGFDRITTDLILRSINQDFGKFDAIVCAGDVPNGRPAPDLIFATMKITNVDHAREVIHVGDTQNDLLAGFYAGVRFNIGVWSGAHTREQLQSTPHTHLLPGIGALPNLFRTFPDFEMDHSG